MGTDLNTESAIKALQKSVKALELQFDKIETLSTTVSSLSITSHNHAIALANLEKLVKQLLTQAGANANISPGNPIHPPAAETSFVGTQSHNHLCQQQDSAMVAQSPGALGPSKAQLPPTKPPTKTTLSSDSMVKETAVVVGTYIATPSDVASLLKAAQSMNVILIPPGGGDPVDKPPVVGANTLPRHNCRHLFMLWTLEDGNWNSYFGSINGENIHYGTPRNPCAADRVPGGSSSGSAVAVGAMLVDFSLGTDTGGSVRVPASYCGIFGIRPSHGVVSTTGVTPMAQSFDTVGWFARDSSILKQVGKVLLPSQDLLPVRPNQIIIAEDCFKLQDFWGSQFTKALINSIEKLYGRETIKHAHLGEIVKENVPSLKPFMSQGSEGQEYIPSLLALSNAMRLLQRYEFKENHGEWVSTIKPNLGPGIAERVWEALKTTDEKIDVCLSVKAELKEALVALLGDAGILAIPTVPGPPPKLQTDPTSLEAFRVKAFSLLSIAGVSGVCQVNIPLGVHGNLPVGISLLAKHGSDLFLLDIVDTIYGTLKEQVELLKE
nr:amidase 1 [Ipomoea batatas]